MHVIVVKTPNEQAPTLGQALAHSKAHSVRTLYRRAIGTLVVNGLGTIALLKLGFDPNQVLLGLLIASGVEAAIWSLSYILRRKHLLDEEDE